MLIKIDEVQLDNLHLKIREMQLENRKLRSINTSLVRQVEVLRNSWVSAEEIPGGGSDTDAVSCSRTAC